MINSKEGPKNRAMGNAIDSLKEIMPKEKAEETVAFLFKKFPPIISIINVQNELATMQSDMVAIIGGGGNSKGALCCYIRDA